MSNYPFKKCVMCGKQLPRTSTTDVCSSCAKQKKESQDGCSFCKETECIASGQFLLDNGSEAFCCIRLDMEFNQIDAEFGVSSPVGQLRGEWTSALDINYCPVCGRKLPKTEYM